MPKTNARKRQVDRLWHILSDGKVHTRLELYRKTGIMGMTQRISELRQLGCVIDCTEKRVRGTRYTSYQLRRW